MVSEWPYMVVSHVFARMAQWFGRWIASQGVPNFKTTGWILGWLNISSFQSWWNKLVKGWGSWSSSIKRHQKVCDNGDLVEGDKYFFYLAQNIFKKDF